ncbi:MAG: 6-phosphogluconolactonase [Pontiellaceae bacterium]
MIKIKTFESTDNLYTEVKKVLKVTLTQIGQLMLSGGKTPYKIYNEIGIEKYVVNPNCTIFLSDERCVPPDSTYNNSFNLLPMLNALKIRSQFIQIRTDISPKEASLIYNDELKKMNNINLGLLGIGLDGHTAGIFSKKDIINSKTLSQYCIRPDGYHGVSVSTSLIQKIDKIIIIATGNEKKSILQRLKNDPESIPAGIIMKSHKNAEVWTDIILKD